MFLLAVVHILHVIQHMVTSIRILPVKWIQNHVHENSSTFEKEKDPGAGHFPKKLKRVKSQFRQSGILGGGPPWAEMEGTGISPCKLVESVSDSISSTVY